MRRAFTLIELLVVISIIALLIAILLPTLSAVRRNAQYTQCMTQLRGFGQALNAYAGDNKDYLTHPNWGPESGGWLYAKHAVENDPSSPWVTPANTPFDQRDKLRETGLLFEYVGNNTEYYRCPADPGPFDDNKRPAYAMTSYQFSGVMSAFRKEFNNVYRMDECRTSGYFIWGNTTNPAETNWNDGSNFPDEPINDRHDDGAPIGRLDASVTRISVAEYTERTKSFGKDKDFKFVKYMKKPSP